VKTFGRYQLLRRIAAGGMAEVFLASGPNPVGADLVALKLIHAHIAEDQGFMAMFLDEARLTAPLSHPNLVQIYDLGLEERRLYLCMEYIRGHPLHLVGQKAHSRGQGIGAARAAAIVKQAALGLHHAHEARSPDGRLLNLIHRDVSPQNLMLDLEGTVKVVDFGVAKAQGRLATSQKGGGLKGKAGYSAPEQLRSQPIDRRADVFALGSVLFELATGAPLFPGHNEAEILQRMLFEPLPDLRAVPDLPRPLAELIATAVAEKPSARFDSALDLADALSDFLEPSGTGKTQLAQLMGQLFPQLPRTAREVLGAEPALSESATDRSARLDPPDTPTRAYPMRPALPPEPELPTAAASPFEDSTLAAPLPPLPPLPVVDDEERTQAVPARPRPRTSSRGPRHALERTVPEVEVDLVPTLEQRRRSRNELALARDADDGDTHTETKPAPPPRRPSARRRTGAWPFIFGAVAVLAGAATYFGLSAKPASTLAPAAPATAALPVPELHSSAAATAVSPERAPSVPAPPEPIAAPAKPEEPAEPTRHHASGTLTVVSAPWAKVKLDGREIGVTPLYNHVVRAGTHRLELYNPDRKLRRVLSVNVSAHQDTYEKVRLEEQ